MFESILGHQRQLRVLGDDILGDRMSHAYLFVGPEEVGKSTVVKSFVSQAIVGHDFACGAKLCSVCRSIRVGGGKQMQFYWDSGESIKADDMRNMIDSLSLKPLGGFYFCVIENIERMTHAAANVFLKILEEPPEGVVFLLMSVHVKTVLPTVLSRVRSVRFSDVGEDVLRAYLDRRDFDEQSISHILRLSGGKVGLVMKLMEDSEYLERFTQLFESIHELFLKGDLVDSFAFVEKITKKDADSRLLFDVLRLMVMYFREKGVAHHSRSLRLLQETKHLLLSTNVNKRMLMEHLFLEMGEF